MFDTQNPSADDELFELLANPRRRLLLYHLFNRGDGIHLSDLSRDIVDFERDVPLEEVDDEAITSVYVSLYQTHIPALEEQGIVEYDDDERVVYLGDRADEIVRVLRNSEERKRRWGTYYLLVGLACGWVVLVDALPSVGVPRLVVATFVIVGAMALPLLALGHYYDTRIRQPRESTIDELVC